MADMAAIDQLEVCWEEMRMLGVRRVIPSRTSTPPPPSKASCGEHGGTSARRATRAKVMSWAWERRAAKC
jgi:hypothetical protein